MKSTRIYGRCDDCGGSEGDCTCDQGKPPQLTLRQLEVFNLILEEGGDWSPRRLGKLLGVTDARALQIMRGIAGQGLLEPIRPRAYTYRMPDFLPAPPPPPALKTETPQEMSDRADAVMAKCRKRGAVSMADLENLNDMVHKLTLATERMRSLRAFTLWRYEKAVAQRDVIKRDAHTVTLFFIDTGKKAFAAPDELPEYAARLLRDTEEMLDRRHQDLLPRSPTED